MIERWDYIISPLPTHAVCNNLFLFLYFKFISPKLFVIPSWCNFLFPFCDTRLSVNFVPSNIFHLYSKMIGSLFTLSPSAGTFSCVSWYFLYTNSSFSTKQHTSITLQTMFSTKLNIHNVILFKECINVCIFYVHVWSDAISLQIMQFMASTIKYSVFCKYVPFTTFPYNSSHVVTSDQPKQ